MWKTRNKRQLVSFGLRLERGAAAPLSNVNVCKAGNLKYREIEIAIRSQWASLFFKFYRERGVLVFVGAHFNGSAPHSDIRGCTCIRKIRDSGSYRTQNPELIALENGNCC